MIRYSADVIVIGAGIAGVTAAIELLDRGRRVLLLDRDTEENMGGLAKESFGGIWFAGTPLQKRYGIRDGAQQGLRDWHAFADFGPDDHWPRAWAEAYVHRANEEIYDWLRGIGVQFMPMPLWVERGLHTPGNSVPRWHIVWGTGHELQVVLNAHLLARPNRDRLDLRFDHRVESLVVTNGRVTGCRGRLEGADDEFEASAENVVIASGGINGNLDRVRQNWHADWSQPPATLLNGSHKYADGTLHDAAAAHGARITHLDWQWNYAAGVHHWQPRKPSHGLSLVPPKSALWLNWRGERIGPMPLVTGFDTHDLVAQICRQERAYSWQLLNRRIMLKELAISGGEFNPAFRRKNRLAVARDMVLGNHWLYDQMTQFCPDVVVAPTVEALVEKMNGAVRRRVGRRRCGPHGGDELRRHHRSRPAVPHRRAIAPHRVRAPLDRRPAAHLQVPADPRAVGRSADRDPRVHHQPQEHGRTADRPGMPRARTYRRTASRPVCRGRKRRLWRWRDERQARPRRHVPRRVPARWPDSGRVA